MSAPRMVAVATILVVDDEPRIVQLVRDYLEHGGFTVLTAVDGPTALRTARTGRPDLVVLDLGLPGLDGLDVARSLRREGEVPIIMLTARTEESDKLVGLELGADDYLTKPFSPKELVARVRGVLRRARNGSGPRMETTARSPAAVVAGRRAISTRTVGSPRLRTAAIHPLDRMLCPVRDCRGASCRGPCRSAVWPRRIPSLLSLSDP